MSNERANGAVGLADLHAIVVSRVERQMSCFRRFMAGMPATTENTTAAGARGVMDAEEEVQTLTADHYRREKAQNAPCYYGLKTLH